MTPAFHYCSKHGNKNDRQCIKLYLCLVYEIPLSNMGKHKIFMMLTGSVGHIMPHMILEHMSVICVDIVRSICII
jgi:hypothetical protein